MLREATIQMTNGIRHARKVVTLKKKESSSQTIKKNIKHKT